MVEQYWQAKPAHLMLWARRLRERFCREKSFVSQTKVYKVTKCHPPLTRHSALLNTSISLAPIASSEGMAACTALGCGWERCSQRNTRLRRTLLSPFPTEEHTRLSAIRTREEFRLKWLSSEIITPDGVLLSQIRKNVKRLLTLS